MSGARQGSITVGDQIDEIVEIASFSLPLSLPSFPPSLPPKAEFGSHSVLHFLGTRASMVPEHEEAWTVVI